MPAACATAVADAVAERAIDLLTTERNFLEASRIKMMALAAKRFNWDRIAKEWEAVLSGEKKE
jgi:glycosyltransferase involved in cell wall biosynthesis